MPTAHASRRISLDYNKLAAQCLASQHALQKAQSRSHASLAPDFHHSSFKALDLGHDPYSVISLVILPIAID